MPFLLPSQQYHSIETRTHTHPFNGPVSRTTRVGRYQKDKTNLDFTEARDSEWHWHQLGICKSAPHSRQIIMPAPYHSVFYRPDTLPATQPTASKHWRLISQHWNKRSITLAVLSKELPFGDQLSTPSVICWYWVPFYSSKVCFIFGTWMGIKVDGFGVKNMKSNDWHLWFSSFQWLYVYIV